MHHVAMQSTGVCWEPVYETQESNFQVVLAKAPHIKNVPGRKTDVCDAEWIAHLLRYGAIRGSFIPPESVREVRDLTKYRTSLRLEKASDVNRFPGDANIKLLFMGTDVTGVLARGDPPRASTRRNGHRVSGAVGSGQGEQEDLGVAKGVGGLPEAAPPADYILGPGSYRLP
ncbi:MAG: transposase [Bacillota bacterium]